MFGHQGDQSAQPDPNQISDQSIDGALSDESTTTATTQTVQPSTPTAAPVSAPPTDSPANDQPASSALSTPAADVPDANDLIDIKQQALTQLSPLIGHLDQSPEEKFRTTMMMIQASDDQSLIRSAYDAAQQIEDEKTRAQALLDIVNEINYFTQQHDAQA